MSLTGNQRRYLSKRAHSLKPVIMVGGSGLTGGVLVAVKEALESHELIKVRFISHKECRKILAEKMATTSGANLVAVIGHVAILFKPSDKPEKRRISLPLEGPEGGGNGS